MADKSVTLYYPEGLQRKELFPNSINFTFFERITPYKSKPRDLSIHLYMPEDFGQPSTVAWDKYSRIGGAAKLGNAAFNAWASKFSSANSSWGARIARGLGYLSSAGADDWLKDATSDFTSTTVNPYLAQIFKGVNFRNFTFTFRFVPYSEKDCDTIHTIIKEFRKAALPESRWHPGADPAENASLAPALSYPDEVEIKYLNNGENNKFIHKFKRSVITKLDVKYTGAGMMSMMRNGFPAETILSLDFVETEIVLRNDIEIDSKGKGGF